MLPTATKVAMRLTRFSPISFCRQAKHIESPQGIYRAAAGGISSDASAAHIDVESSCETHDRLDAGQDTKGLKMVKKRGGNTLKSHFSIVPDQKVRKNARFFLFFLKQM
jgi:hypothetical protein